MIEFKLDDNGVQYWSDESKCWLRAEVNEILYGILERLDKKKEDKT